VAEIAVEDKNTSLEVQVDSNAAGVTITLRHQGTASLAPVADPGASLAYPLSFREVDMGQGAGRAGPAEPGSPGAAEEGSVTGVIVPPSALRWPDEPVGETGVRGVIPPGALSEFEEQLRSDPGLIRGVVMDPDSPGEVIGYRVPATTGVTKLVDREGTLVHMDEIGLETPPVDPIDLIPTPGSAAKAGVGVAGKLGIKALGKKAAVSGVTIPKAVIARMRGVSRALGGRALRKGATEAPNFVRRITQAGLNHSFDRHAAQWFGRAVKRETHMGLWRALIERTAASAKTFPWSTGAAETIGHLAQVEGKWFVVQFFKETGELATAFVPNSKQLASMLRLLKGAP
jgi:hypothetical protein